MTWCIYFKKETSVRLNQLRRVVVQLVSELSAPIFLMHMVLIFTMNLCKLSTMLPFLTPPKGRLQGLSINIIFCFPLSANVHLISLLHGPIKQFLGFSVTL